VSRWHDEFDNHPFQGIWNQLQNVTANISVDDIAIATDIQEVARLRKVMKYLENLLEASDKELVPLSTWAQFHKQCQNCLNQVNTYNSNRNIAHLEAANGHLDNLLSYLKPYVVDGKSAARASTMAQKEYNNTVSDHVSSFVEEATTAILKIQNTLREADQVANEIEPIVDKAKQFNDWAFKGIGGEDSLESRIDDWAHEVENTASEISSYHQSLLIKKSDKNSIEHEVKELVRGVNEDSAALKGIISDAKINLKPLNEFNTQVFGAPDSTEAGKQGLKKELEIRRADLEALIGGHETKYSALEAEIESLIPGATTAGLATAYSELKDNAGLSVARFNNLFLASIAGLMLISLFSVVQGFTLIPFNISLMSVLGWEETLKLILQRLPFVLPLVWLALFASQRRSEFHRLEQEYAHKESTAKSYHSFKQQITEMGEAEEHKGLLTQLITSAVETVAFNASATLDKKHGDKLPSQSAIDGAFNLLEKVKGIAK